MKMKDRFYGYLQNAKLLFEILYIIFVTTLKGFIVLGLIVGVGALTIYLLVNFTWIVGVILVLFASFLAGIAVEGRL